MNPAHWLMGLAFALCGLFATESQAAVTVLGGDVYDGAGGPLLGGEVYHALSRVRIPPGETLTIQAGAILKFGDQIDMVVDGRLLVQGTSQGRAIITSIRDDSPEAGGDTNGDGSQTTPSAGDWDNIFFASDQEIHVIEHARVRYAGSGTFANTFFLSTNRPTLEIRHVIFEDHDDAAINLESGATESVIENCHFTRCRRPSVFVRPDQLKNLRHNTAVDNRDHDHWTFPTNDTKFREDATIRVENLLDGFLRGTFEVDIGVTLVLEEGVVVKSFSGSDIDVDGTLICNGRETNPVVFTSFLDDSFAGDSNDDGDATIPGPNDWEGLDLGRQSGNHELEHTIIRHAGAGAIVLRDDCGFTARHCTLEKNGHDAFRCLSVSSISPFLIEDCLVQQNAGLVMSGARLWMIPSIHRPRGTNNGGNFIEVTGGHAPGLVIAPDNCPFGTLLYDAGDISAPNSLTLEPGVTLKMAPGARAIVRNGSFVARGTAQRPIVITSVHDDSAGGADADGTSPQSGDWSQWQISRDAGVVELEHVHFRYGGGAFHPTLECLAPGAQVSRVRSEMGLDAGFHFEGTTQPIESLIAGYNIGDGIQLDDCLLRNATVRGNQGGGIFRRGGIVRIENSISWENASGNFVNLTEQDVFFSNGDFAGTNGNIDEDPLFFVSDGGPYHLSEGSPCLDAGDPLQRLRGDDLVGNPRLTDIDLSSSLEVDMGAIETPLMRLYGPLEATPGDTIRLTTLSSLPLPSFMFVGLASSDALLPAFGNLLIDLAGFWQLLDWPAPPSVIDVPLPSNTPAPLSIFLQQLGVSGTNGGLSNLVQIDVVP